VSDEPTWAEAPRVAWKEGEMIALRRGSEFSSDLQTFLESCAIAEIEPDSQEPWIARFRAASVTASHLGDTIQDFIPFEEGVPADSELPFNSEGLLGMIEQELPDDDRDRLDGDYLKPLLKHITAEMTENMPDICTEGWTEVDLPKWVRDLADDINSVLAVFRVGAWWCDDEVPIIPANWRELVSHARPIADHLFCPGCGMRHVDTGEWACIPHKTHRCVDYTYFDKDQSSPHSPHHVKGCGHEWRPHEFHTVGLPANLSLPAGPNGENPWVTNA